METVDTQALETQVKAMYERVALEPAGRFHFEMGRQLAERLGYDSEFLDRVPAEAIESFAGVGHHMGMALLEVGQSVLDLGSGSGLDTFVAAELVGARGRVVGVDMTEAQRSKAERLRVRAGYAQVSFVDAYIDELPFEDASFSRVISNGVINLAEDKLRTFREAARVLKPGGLLAISDIVSSTPLPERITCNADLWAACIGGAMQRETYQDAIAAAGLEVTYVVRNDEYRFISDRADGAATKFGVQSISLVAAKR